MIFLKVQPKNRIFPDIFQFGPTHVCERQCVRRVIDLDLMRISFTFFSHGSAAAYTRRTGVAIGQSWHWHLFRYVPFGCNHLDMCTIRMPRTCIHAADLYMHASYNRYDRQRRRLYHWHGSQWPREGFWYVNMIWFGICAHWVSGRDFIRFCWSNNAKSRTDFFFFTCWCVLARAHVGQIKRGDQLVAVDGTEIKGWDVKVHIISCHVLEKSKCIHACLNLLGRVGNREHDKPHRKCTHPSIICC